MSKLVEAAAEFLSRDTFNKQTKNLSEGTTVHSDYEDGYGSVNVKVGDKISQGDIIGTVGSTGRSTGPHLDFRINWFQTRLDPMSVLK